MHNVSDQLELATLQAAGEGFILNARHDRTMLHKAECEAIGAMVTAAYPKMFFNTYDEAQEWLDTQFGEADWERCGFCLPPHSN